VPAVSSEHDSGRAQQQIRRSAAAAGAREHRDPGSEACRCPERARSERCGRGEEDQEGESCGAWTGLRGGWSNARGHRTGAFSSPLPEVYERTLSLTTCTAVTSRTRILAPPPLSLLHDGAGEQGRPGLVGALQHRRRAERAGRAERGRADMGGFRLVELSLGAAQLDGACDRCDHQLRRLDAAAAR